MESNDIKLIHGDCLERMKEIPDKSIDMILCDLPFGTTACKWDTIIPFEPLWKQYNRIIKDNGAIVLFGNQPFTSLLINSNIKNFKFSWVWNKKFAANFALHKYQPLRIHEDIIIFSNGTCFFNPQKTIRDKPIKKGGNKRMPETTNIKHTQDKYNNKIYNWKEPESIITISNRCEKRGYHPTQKPVALLEYLIKTYTNENNLVLDNTMGSGSTGVAAVNTNRRFIGIEKGDNYFEIAEKRIGDAIKQKQQNLFDK